MCLVSKTNKTYRNLLSAKKNGVEISGYDDPIFKNFFDCLVPELDDHEYFDLEIMEYQIIRHINNIDTDNAINGLMSDLNNLKNEIREMFDANKGLHYLVCPLQKSFIDDDIQFENIVLMKRRDTELDSMKAISDLTGLSEESVIDLLNHTKFSRSKDFLKDNLLILKLEHQTDRVKSFGYSIIQDIFDFIRVLYFSEELETSIFHKYKAYNNAENRHIAILSDEGWRRGHSFNQNANLSLNMDLNFMGNQDMQKKLTQFMKEYTFNRNKDTLAFDFYNAIKLFNRALKYEKFDKEVCNLLLLTAGESLITQGRNEKRIRLSVILPRLVTLNNNSRYDMSMLISSSYRERNNFVHGGFSIFEDEYIDSDKLKNIISKLIVNYFDVYNDDDVQTKRTKMWQDYLNDIFEKSIFSEG